MKRVLMICYYFPPQGGIGSLRASKLATYLPRFGWEPTVIAPRHGAYPNDPSLRAPEERVVRTGSIDLSRIGRRALRIEPASSSPPGARPSALRKLVHRWVYRPDAQIGWYPFALRAGRRALRAAQFDAIHSTSFPITAHRVARRLAGEARLPWVAEFRDLWTDLQTYDSRSRHRSDERLERAILGSAAEVVTVSQSWAERLAAKGAARVSVLTNGFDPDDVPDDALEAPPAIGYLGAYYPDRQRIDAAVEAIARVRRSQDLANLRLRFIGTARASVGPLLDAHRLADATEFTGVVSHDHALRLTRRSKILLLAGPCGAEGQAASLRGHIAAKVFEYLGSGRPVLHLGDPRSEIGELLRPFAGVESVAPDDVDAAERALRALLSIEQPIERPGLECYTHPRLAERLAACLDRNVSRVPP